MTQVHRATPPPACPSGTVGPACLNQHPLPPSASSVLCPSTCSWQLVSCHVLALSHEQPMRLQSARRGAVGWYRLQVWSRVFTLTVRAKHLAENLNQRDWKYQQTKNKNRHVHQHPQMGKTRPLRHCSPARWRRESSTSSAVLANLTTRCQRHNAHGPGFRGKVTLALGVLWDLYQVSSLLPR